MAFSMDTAFLVKSQIKFSFENTKERKSGTEQKKREQCRNVKINSFVKKIKEKVFHFHCSERDTTPTNSLHLSVLWFLSPSASVYLYHPASPLHSLFCPLFPFVLFCFLLFMPIFMEAAMDLVRSVRFHEIKGSCLKKCFCLRWCMYHEIAEIFIAFAGNRNNNHTVLYDMSLYLSHSRLLIFLLLFRSSRVTLFYLLLSFLNLTPSNDFRWHFMRISILC